MGSGIALNLEVDLSTADPVTIRVFLLENLVCFSLYLSVLSICRYAFVIFFVTVALVAPPDVVLPRQHLRVAIDFCCSQR